MKKDTWDSPYKLIYNFNHETLDGLMNPIEEEEFRGEFQMKRKACPINTKGEVVRLVVANLTVIVIMTTVGVDILTHYLAGTFDVKDALLCSMIGSMLMSFVYAWLAYLCPLFMPGWHTLGCVETSVGFFMSKLS